METAWHLLIQKNKTFCHLNPVLPIDLKALAYRLTNEHHCHEPLVWIMSSGSSALSQSSFKLIGLSHKALFASAASVNDHLQVQPEDSWLNILPLFHVGGLSILYRALQADISCHNLWSSDFKWNPSHFIQECQRRQATLTSLVPTQVYDLVKEKLSPPKNLRAIVVGGARLSTELYQQARQLGWPLLPSFGMTEAASQIATAPLQTLNYPPAEEAPLQILSHWLVKCGEDHRLQLKGPSLMAGFYPIFDGVAKDWLDPKDQAGWYVTQDCGRTNGKFLTILARTDEVIKVLGEKVNLASLRNHLASLQKQLPFADRCTLIATPDKRLGYKLVLVGEESRENLEILRQHFNQMVLPFEKIQALVPNIIIPRSPLGKILHGQLLDEIRV